MKNIILIIKGFFMGIANIIPGVSGGTLAITMNIYERLINTINHFFKDIKSNIKFLSLLGIGILIALALGSNVITYSLDKYPLPTIMFFTGLILGGVPMLFNKIKTNINIKNMLVFILTFTFIILIMFLKTNSDVSLDNLNITSYIKLFAVGLVAAATMIVPGISGSFMLMVMGYYEPIINTIKELTSFNNIVNNIIILIPFGLGILAGFIILAKLLEFLFKKYEVITYFGIIGFVLASLIGIFIETVFVFSIASFVVGIILLIIGFGIAYKLGD